MPRYIFIRQLNCFWTAKQIPHGGTSAISESHPLPLVHLDRARLSLDAGVYHPEKQLSPPLILQGYFSLRLALTFPLEPRLRSTIRSPRAERLAQGTAPLQGKLLPSDAKVFPNPVHPLLHCLIHHNGRTPFPIGLSRPLISSIQPHFPA